MWKHDIKSISAYVWVGRYIGVKSYTNCNFVVKIEKSLSRLTKMAYFSLFLKAQSRHIGKEDFEESFRLINFV